MEVINQVKANGGRLLKEVQSEDNLWEVEHDSSVWVKAARQYIRGAEKPYFNVEYEPISPNYDAPNASDEEQPTPFTNKSIPYIRLHDDFDENKIRETVTTQGTYTTVHVTNADHPKW